jgi:integrase
MNLVQLIDELRAAPAGTERLDQLILDHIRPGWYVCSAGSFYSRSVAAALPDEEVVRVEQFHGDGRARWRAWLANEWHSDGNTEALARRLAVLTWQADRQRHAGLPRPFAPSPGAFTAAEGHGLPQEVLARLSSANLNIVVDALCEHIARLEGGQSARRVPRQVHSYDDAEGDSQFAIRIHADRRRDPPITPAGKESATTLWEAFEAWHLDARPRVKNLLRVQRSIRRFVEVHQDRPLNAYTKADVRSFLSMMRRMPRQVPKALKGAAMPAILEFMTAHPETPSVTPKTVNAYLKDLFMVFNFAMACEMSAQNPASNLRVVDRRVQSELRLPFDIEDLRFIFQESPIYAGCLSSRQRFRPGPRIIRDAAFWLPLVALFTGARLGELAVSEVADYKYEKGLWYLDIHAAADNRHLKTISSDRRVPLHSELIRIGFLEYLRQCKAEGHVRVFEKVQGRRNIRSAKGWSRSWRTYMQNIGHRDPKKVFHSFRHTFKGACRDVGIHEEVHDALTGHRPFQAGRRYGRRIALGTLADAMERVRYPGLDLSHLYDARLRRAG